MSSLFDPDDAATVGVPWSVAFRTQRDVALQVPINYVTVPAVSLKAACFSHNQYELTAAQKCFSNLLASGFKRFIIDVYWDTGRSIWSLCPAEIPESASPADDTTSIPVIQSTSFASLTTAQISIRDGLLVFEPAISTSFVDKRPQLLQRQASSIISESSSPASRTTPSIFSTPTLSSTNSTSKPKISSATSTAPIEFPTSGEPLIEIGPYNCTSTLGFQFLTSVLSDYMRNSSTTLDARLNYMVLNIHAAAPYSSPTSPANQPDPSALPSGDNFLGHILSSNLSSYLYTPSMLRTERGDLNQTWRDVDSSIQPAAGYYTTNGSDVLSTPNGWPSESYMEFKRFLRVITSFGTIDPQMASYDFASDEDTIFPVDEIMSLDAVSISASGSVTSGCFFDPNDNTISPKTNSSWAMSTASHLPNLASHPNTTVSIPAISNLTACGISPLLNTSLSNTTADANPLAYLSITYSTLWSWAPNEPSNATITDDDSTNDYRCAALYAEANGRWRATDCRSRHRLACRGSTPYAWTVTSDLSAYTGGSGGCPDNTTFAVPRTALENSYLYAAALASANTGSSDPADPQIIFIDLNSLDYPDCWVTGANTTCPYKNQENQNHTRIVIVPTLATVIVFFLALATFFVKCAANRRDLRRGKRRRNVGGWDYEGVPS